MVSKLKHHTIYCD